MGAYWLATLHKWQTLIGAFLGGAFALFVAWYVARDARVRELRSAGIVVAHTLADMRGQYIQAARRAVSIGLGDESAVAGELASTLALYRPILPPNFYGAIQRLSLVHASLATHLAFAARDFIVADQALTRIESRHGNAHTAAERAAATANVFGDPLIVKSAMESIANHSACAIVMINRLVLSRWAMWHFLRLTLWPDLIECQCEEALREGKFQTTVPDELP